MTTFIELNISPESRKIEISCKCEGEGEGSRYGNNGLPFSIGSGVKNGVTFHVFHQKEIGELLSRNMARTARIQLDGYLLD